MCVCACIALSARVCMHPTFVEEGEVLLDDGEEGYDWWLHVLVAQDVAVLGHIPGWVK